MPTPITCPGCAATGRLPDDCRPNEPVACPVCRTVFTPSQPAAVGARPADPTGLGVWVEPPPALPPPSLDATDAAGRLDWLRDESARFDQHVRTQLAKLEKGRHLIAELESAAEAKAITRELEQNKRAANLAAREADTDRREAELCESAEGLAARETELTAAAARLAEREVAIAEREARRADLEAEIADLSRVAADLRPVVERLRLRHDEAAAIRAELAETKAALDRRMVDVGRMEVALQRQLDELEELEVNLRSELEAREHDLERQRLDLDEQLKLVRLRPAVDNPTPPPAAWAETTTA